MSLTAGQRIGPYEIVSALGAGGPAYARVGLARELRRGLAEAQPRMRR